MLVIQMNEKKLNREELEKLERAFEKNPNYKTSSGYTGNKLTVKEKKEKKNQKKVLTDKQRRLEGLSRKKKRTFWTLQNEIEKMFQKYSKVTAKEPGKETKKDVKTGLKSEGIWANNTYKNYLTKSKTFIKFCVKEYEITSLRELKPAMVVGFMKYLEKKNSSPKTMSGYKNSIQKLGEFGNKEGVKRMAKLDSKTAWDLIPQYSKDEYRRGKQGGYSIKDVQVMSKKAGEAFSPLHRAGLELFGYSGPRMDEFRKIKWKHLDFDKNRIYMTDQGMTKGNRPRFLEVRPETMQLLKEINDTNLHSDSNERIWGSRMTEKDVRSFIKECSRLGKRRYSAVHDFRRSMVQYQTRELDHLLRHNKIDKEGIVDLILEAVGVDERLNPIIKVYPPKLDANGKRAYGVRKNGSRFPLDDKTKPPVFKHKYVKEDLMKKRIDYLKNVRISLLLGHNRPDASSTYRPSKKNK